MPYVRARMPKRRGIGVSPATVFSPGDTAFASYDPVTGRYLGGSMLMDIYCGSFLGSSDPVCRIPTPAQVRAQQIAELQRTSAPQDAIDRAVAAGDAAVAIDQAARPGDYAAQCAAANHPDLAATLGPSVVAALFPTDADCNPKTSWLLIVAGGMLGVVLFKNLVGGRR